VAKGGHDTRPRIATVAHQMPASRDRDCGMPESDGMRQWDTRCQRASVDTVAYHSIKHGIMGCQRIRLRTVGCQRLMARDHGMPHAICKDNAKSK
jgi:hypothetical protein